MKDQILSSSFERDTKPDYLKGLNIITRNKNILNIEVGDIVIFIEPSNDSRKYLMDGNVLNVTDAHATISYLDGYKSRADQIKFEDIVAVVDQGNGKFQEIENYTGYFRTPLPENFKSLKSEVKL